MTSGLHHITLLTRKVQANVDFYAGFLGLRLIKRTGGFEDAEQLHLFYGDRLGSPGSLVTFLVWEDGAAGRVGHGQIGEFALAIDPASIGFWIERALRFHFTAEVPYQEFGEPVLRLRDPDGIAVKLVGVPNRPQSDWTTADIPAEHAMRRLRGVTLFSEADDATASFVSTHFGFAAQSQQGRIRRLVSEAGDVVDVRDAGGFWPGGPGTGTADHVAFRAAGNADIVKLEADLARLNSSPTNVHDRKYFTSLYVREPGGILFEFATDGPGFTVDEPEATLGQALFVPGGDDERAEDIKVALPQFGLPGQDRVVYRDLPFIHRFHTPEIGDGSFLVLLHGSGGNETDLLALGRHIAPHAILLGIRGRSYEEGSPRWFKRTADRFDQADIAFEAEAFTAFLQAAEGDYGVVPERTNFIGYSNGANFLAAHMQLFPGVVKRAALLRAMPVLDAPPADAHLEGTKVLLVAGENDPFRSHSTSLAEILRGQGAAVVERVIEAPHLIVPGDAGIIRDWLGSL